MYIIKNPAQNVKNLLTHSTSLLANGTAGKRVSDITCTVKSFLIDCQAIVCLFFFGTYKYIQPLGFIHLIMCSVELLVFAYAERDFFKYS